MTKVLRQESQRTYEDPFSLMFEKKMEVERESKVIKE